MKRTFRTALCGCVALGALYGAPVADAQPRDITLPELLGGPDGDAIRAPDTMPAPKPTVPYFDDDGRALKPAAPAPAKPPQAKPVPPAKVAARPKPSAKARVVEAAKTPVRAPRKSGGAATASAKPPPAVKRATPSFAAVRLGRTQQEIAPAPVSLPQEAAAAPSLSNLPEPAPELAQEDAAPAPSSVQEAPSVAADQDFDPDFAAVEMTIQRGVRRGDFTRRQAASLYAELDDIAAMDDYFRRSRRSGPASQARVAERLTDLRDWLAHASPE